MTVAEAVAACVAASGTRDAFALVGSGNLRLANALVAAGVRYHGACHEAGAVAMADGYARVSGSVGVATVHQGPGLTNALTAVAEAARSRTPLVLLAAESASGVLDDWIASPAAPLLLDCKVNPEVAADW